MLKIFLCTLSSFFVSSQISLAQVTPDGTTNTTVNPNENNFTIENGDRAGDNLFHSFQDFSVTNGGSAVFNNATDISNIFSRVTGGNISNIDGLIKANGSASLFLINPVGIIFGEGASLDIGGSFYGSSATTILFEDGEFSAADLDNPPLLTVNAPIGLGFRDNPGDIQLQGSDIFIKPFNQTLALLGGNVDIEEGSRIAVPSGSIQLGGVATAGIISLNQDLNFTIPEDVTRADVSIGLGDNFDPTRLDVGSQQGGSIFIKGKNITTKNTDMLSGAFSESATPQSQGGTIEIDASESVTLTEGTLLSGSSLGTGSAGNIIINAKDTITFDELTTLSNDQRRSQIQRQTGNIDITTATFILNDPSGINLQSGASIGDINIEANSVSLNGGSIVSQNRGSEDAGDINIQTQSLSLSKVGIIFSNSIDAEAVGDITINASESVSISGIDEYFGRFSSRVSISTGDLATGEQGTISITTKELSIFDGGVVSGGLTPESNVQGGNIVVNADILNLSGGGQILTVAFDEGNAGNITLNVADQINISGSDPTFFSRREKVFEFLNQNEDPKYLPLEELVLDTISPESGIFASTGSESLGNAGSIFISGMTADSGSLSLPNLNLTDSGRIAVNSRGEGNGGNVFIQGSSLTLENNAVILADSPQGLSGNVNLDIEDNITLKNDSFISARATNNADGGNVNINTDFIIAFPGNNDIIASAVRGNGGNITIDAEAILGIAERRLSPLTNDINASSQTNGLDGTISISTLDINPIQGVAELPTNIFVPEQTTVQACNANREAAAKNDFTIAGKGGVPPAPELPLDSHNIYINGETNSASAIPQAIETSQGKIQPARGVKITESGDIILTAYRTGNIEDRLPEKRNCGQV